MCDFARGAPLPEVRHWACAFCTWAGNAYSATGRKGRCEACARVPVEEGGSAAPVAPAEGAAAAAAAAAGKGGAGGAGAGGGGGGGAVGGFWVCSTCTAKTYGASTSCGVCGAHKLGV